MSNDFTIIMAIAIVEALVIGWLVSDKLGLIKNLKIDNNPNDNRGDTDNTKEPRGSRDKDSNNQNSHSPAD